MGKKGEIRKKKNRDNSICALFYDIFKKKKKKKGTVEGTKHIMFVLWLIPGFFLAALFLSLQ